MSSPEDVTSAVVQTLESQKAPYMLVGSFSSNVYGIARSTKDADFVIDVRDAEVMARLVEALAPVLEFDPQPSFETLTGSVRHEATARDCPFRVEFFELANDEFARSRFERRIRIDSEVFGCPVTIPTAEDVVIQKLRWARPKDLEDARDVMAVQGDNLDREFVASWCTRLGITDRYQALVATVPDI